MKRLPTLLSFLPLTFAAAMVLPAHAERADRDQPMHIESDALRHDELQQTSVFTGNVVMTKGSIVLRGAQLDVRQDPQGYQYGVVTAASGKRAFFRQKRDTAPGAPEEFVEGEAEVIEYDGRKDDVRLIRRAQQGQLGKFTTFHSRFLQNSAPLRVGGGQSVPARVACLLVNAHQGGIDAGVAQLLF